MPRKNKKQKTISVFWVGDSLYSIPVDYIEETILSPDYITPVPNVDSRFEGILNHRIDICTVISLKVCFGKKFSKGSHITILNYKGHKYGISIDTVPEIIDMGNKEQVKAFREIKPEVQEPGFEFINGFLTLVLVGEEKALNVTSIDIEKLLDTLVTL